MSGLIITATIAPPFSTFEAFSLIRAMSSWLHQGSSLHAAETRGVATRAAAGSDPRKGHPKAQGTCRGSTALWFRKKNPRPIQNPQRYYHPGPQASQLCLHSAIIQAALLSHSPCFAQPSHSLCASMQVDAEAAGSVARARRRPAASIAGVTATMSSSRTRVRPKKLKKHVGTRRAGAAHQRRC